MFCQVETKKLLGNLPTVSFLLETVFPRGRNIFNKSLILHSSCSLSMQRRIKLISTISKIKSQIPFSSYKV